MLLLEELFLNSQESLIFFLAHALGREAALVEFEQYHEEGLRLAFDDGGVLGHELPKLEILLPVIREEGEQLLDNFLRRPRSTVSRRATAYNFRKLKCVISFMSLSQRASNFSLSLWTIIVGKRSM